MTKFIPCGWNKGQGKAYKWLVDHLNFDGEECLIWPFSRTRGYGGFSHMGERYYAHRFMCELVHGAPPSPLHEAAHSCGRGHDGCVHPGHVSWKTKSENLLDCAGHGTQARSHYGTKGFLTADQAAQIRGLKGVKTQWQIAEQFGVSESTISDIWLGRTHSRKHKRDYWTEEEDKKLFEGVSQGMKREALSAHVGRSKLSINSRLYRIRLSERALPQGTHF